MMVKVAIPAFVVRFVADKQMDNHAMAMIQGVAFPTVRL